MRIDFGFRLVYTVGGLRKCYDDSFPIVRWDRELSLECFSSRSGTGTVAYAVISTPVK
jgi:hypothetical protein